MPWGRLLARAFLLRRVSRDLTRIADALDAQTTALTRLADQFAPVVDPRVRPEADTGVSHLDDDDAAEALRYVARTQRDTGHMPDDEEILIHLADEKTQDLHERLTRREQELQRLMEARQ